ncbi:MAG: adenylosuccinate lyase [Halanaerobium sp.]|nr:adenylosuccinate lyase [Halanaerobium sp.]
MIPRYSLPEMSRLWKPEAKYNRWLDIEVAVCKALAEIGQIPAAAAEEIAARASFDLDRIKEIEAVTRHDILAFVQNVNEGLGSLSQYFHRGLTSSDVKDTALSLALKEACTLITAETRELQREVGEQAVRYKDQVMVGRTHGVHAEPITLGLKFAVWYQELGRQLERLERVREEVSAGKISGAVGTYANISPQVEKLACSYLGLTPASISTQIIQRDRHASLLNTLALLAGSLEKFATEIRNLQRTDILEVEEAFRKGQKGSSAMPHKKNPIVSERVSGLARIVRSNAQAGMENINLWHERDLSHSSVERVIIPDSTGLIYYMLRKFRDVVSNLQVNADKMAENLDRTHGLIFSQRVLLALMGKGLPREEAYELVQRNAMKAWEQPGTFKEYLLADGQVASHLSRVEIEEIFHHENFLEHVDYIFQQVGLL